VDVYLVDGTYELFRYFFALPSHVTAGGREVAATRGVLGTVLQIIEAGNRHLGVATDHVIESFRNDLWPSYKTSAGIDPRLLQQFPLLEEGLQALGVATWPMVDLEADDALAGAALQAAAWPAVERVFICSPDKDLAQCVVDGRVVQLERRTGRLFDAAGVVEKFGVPPAAIPDYLALVGDSADGYPGLPGWGSRSAAALLQRYGSLDAIPLDAAQWDVVVRGAGKLCRTLAEQRDFAFLFRDLATLRTAQPLLTGPDDLAWRGPLPEFEALCSRIEAPQLLERARLLAAR
jgi:5'-3' exonuclease